MLAALDHPAVPRLLGSYDDGDWVALLLEDVDGRQPTLPWQRDELAVVLDTVADLGRMPSPVDGLPAATGGFGRMLGYWVELATTPPDDLDPWARRHLERLAERATQPMETAGDALLHLDLRADNLLLTPDGRVRVVDRAHTAYGEPWMDVVVLLLEVGAYGGFDVEDLLAQHPLTRAADPAQVTHLLLAVSGMFQQRCRQPAPRGLPTIRAFQRAYARTATAWLRRRLAW